jgi:hypothetical protein
VSGFYRFPDLGMLEGMRNHPSEQPNNIDIIKVCVTPQPISLYSVATCWVETDSSKD